MYERFAIFLRTLQNIYKRFALMYITTILLQHIPNVLQYINANVFQYPFAIPYIINVYYNCFAIYLQRKLIILLTFCNIFTNVFQYIYKRFATYVLYIQTFRTSYIRIAISYKRSATNIQTFCVILSTFWNMFTIILQHILQTLCNTFTNIFQYIYNNLAT